LLSSPVYLTKPGFELGTDRRVNTTRIPRSDRPIWSLSEGRVRRPLHARVFVCVATLGRLRQAAYTGEGVACRVSWLLLLGRF
jgi:hypothetical protein